MDEEHAWSRLQCRREKCLSVLQDVPGAEEALAEIADIEEVLTKLWTQLESHCHAPTKYPPPEKGNMLSRWVNQVVIPLAVANQLCENNQLGENNVDPE